MSGSYSLLQLKPLPVCTQLCASDFDKENQPVPRYKTIGGIFQDTEHAWTACGPHFSVANSKTGSKVAAWSFGSFLKDLSTRVVCVDELHQREGKLPLLVVGLENSFSGGIVCVFDIADSRVLRAVQIQEKVTNLHVIDASYDKCPLPGPLRAFDGIVAVGTVGGNVYLLDMCCQTYDEVSNGTSPDDIKDEIDPCSVKVLSLQEVYSLELHKQQAIKDGEHVAIHLNAMTKSVIPHFVLKGPKGEDRIYVNKEEVAVSALHYCPQLGSLLVGYNFGAWQLWNLIDLQLVYTSPVYEENVPVFHFAIQEPCDDPKAFCYVWTVYSNSESFQNGFPFAVLYSLTYSSKEWHEGYGILYQNLMSCAVRFQMDLILLDDMQIDRTQQGAQCLRVQAINKDVLKSGSLQDHQEDVLAVCCFVWSGWSSASNNVIQTYMSLFDLNQWYKEQMPSSTEFKKCEAYMTYVCLSNLLYATSAESSKCLDVRIDTATLSQFFGSQKLEEHYYPSSLAFDLCMLRDADISFIKNQGSQRALLSRLESAGPLAVLKPTELFQEVLDTGLYPLFVDVPNNPTVEDQRELLLSTALEQQLLGWLCRCASAWSTGCHSATGCTLQFLVTWGWQRAQLLKQNANRLSIPLFDYSGLRLDANTHNLLSNCARQLKNLATLFAYITQRFIRFLLHSDIIKQQCESLQMVSVHLEVLQWLLNVGLLPECPMSSYPRTDEYNRISAPYPVDNLIEYYDERRTYLQSHNKEQFSTSGSLLFIDNLIEMECGGSRLRKQWQIDGGTGLYPPPSLQALLRTYLVEGVDISYKHCVIVYVFLDLAMTLNQSRYKPVITHLIKFPAVFQLSPSVIKITQAFWQLDHGDFATAMEQLLDPLVSHEDLKMWHHRVALRALLAQQQHSFALTYLQVRQPPVTEVQDLCTILSLFIVNNMIDEAFHFQRQNRSAKNEAELLRHFFRECDRHGQIKYILHLTFMAIEEQAFLNYLRDVKHPDNRDLQMFYFVHRFQYMDVFKLGNKQKEDRTHQQGLKGQANLGFRDFMINELTDSLPKISRSLINLCKEERHGIWKEVERPKPFSVFVHNTAEQIKYKSTMINAALSKAKETWVHPILDKSIKDDSVAHQFTEEMPFLSTPKAVLCKPRLATPVIFPKINQSNSFEQNDDATPPKRIKLKNDGTDVSQDIKLDTPVVKRKALRRSGSAISAQLKYSPETPHSILKVAYLNSPDASKDVEELEGLQTFTRRDPVSETHEATTTIGSFRSLSRKGSLGLTPRKPLPRTPRHAVRFDISRASSESSVSNTSESHFEVVQEAIVHSPMDGTRDKSLELKIGIEPSSKNSSLSADEVFYSPNTSLNNSTESKLITNVENMKCDEGKDLALIVTQQSIMLDNDNLTPSPKSRRSYKKHTEVTIEIREDTIESQDDTVNANTNAMPISLLTPKTPKSRRSYKGGLSEIEVRSSPRLRKLRSDTSFENKDSISTSKKVLQLSPEDNQLRPKIETPKPKVRARRSLNRQVLENSIILNNTNVGISEESASRRNVSSVITKPHESFEKNDVAQTSLKNDTYEQLIEQEPEVKHESKYGNEDITLFHLEDSFDEVKEERELIALDDEVVDNFVESFPKNVNLDFDEKSIKIIKNEAGSDEYEREENNESITNKNKTEEVEDILDNDVCESDTETVLIELKDSTHIINVNEESSNDSSKFPNSKTCISGMSTTSEFNKAICEEEEENIEIFEIDQDYSVPLNEEEICIDSLEVLSCANVIIDNNVEPVENLDTDEHKEAIKNNLNCENVDQHDDDEDSVIQIIELVSSDEEDGNNESCIEEIDEEETALIYSSEISELSVNHPMTSGSISASKPYKKQDSESYSSSALEDNRNIAGFISSRDISISSIDVDRSETIIQETNVEAVEIRGVEEGSKTNGDDVEVEEILQNEVNITEYVEEEIEDDNNVAFVEYGIESTRKDVKLTEANENLNDDAVDATIDENNKDVDVSKVSKGEFEISGVVAFADGETKGDVEEDEKDINEDSAERLLSTMQKSEISAVLLEAIPEESSSELKDGLDIADTSKPEISSSNETSAAGSQDNELTKSNKNGDVVSLQEENSNAEVQLANNITWFNQTIPDTDILEKTAFCTLKEKTLRISCGSDILDQSLEVENTNLRKNLSLLYKSDILDQTNQSLEVEDKQSNENLKKISTPARRSKRLSSLQASTPSDSPGFKRNTRRSVSLNNIEAVEMIPKATTSRDIIEELPLNQSYTPSRRKRSASETEDLSAGKRTLHSLSIDIDLKKGEVQPSPSTRTRRALSVTADLPVIQEESCLSKFERNSKTQSPSLVDDKKSTKSENVRKQKQPTKKIKKPKSAVVTATDESSIEEYSISRRLTRRQATLLKNAFNSSKINIEITEEQEHSDAESDVSENREGGPDVSKIDPIELLNKPAFEGNPDPEEQKIEPKSPASSIPESPIGSQRRRLRSRGSLSITSEGSVGNTAPLEASTSRSQKGSSAKRKIIVGTASKRKQRSKSVDVLNVTDGPSPPKLIKTRRGSKNSESSSVASNISKAQSLVEHTKQISKTRSQPALVDHAENTASPIRRSERRSLLTKSNLSNIAEEAAVKQKGLRTRSTAK